MMSKDKNNKVKVFTDKNNNVFITDDSGEITFNGQPVEERPDVILVEHKDEHQSEEQDEN